MAQWVELRAVSEPVGMLRVAGAVLTFIAFCLAAAAGQTSGLHMGSSTAVSYWAWCMFCWVFCCLLSLLILLLELTRVTEQLQDPERRERLLYFYWDDFKAGFAMLAALMLFTASVIYPAVLLDGGAEGVVATVMSWLSVAPYVGQVVLLLRHEQQVSGFLSTVPGRLKIVETLVACVLFAALDPKRYGGSGPLQWCVAAYSLCFIGALAIIILTLSARLPPRLPFDPIVCTYNVLAACCYMSATVVWPLYAFRDNPRPSPPATPTPTSTPIPIPTPGGKLLPSANSLDWDSLVVVTFMTIINLILYLLDSAYSIYVVVMQRRDN